MAIYHAHLKILSRSDRNTVQAIAYRTGTDLYDERTGKWFYYSNKKDVIHVELILPENAPQWAQDLQLKISQDRNAGIQELSNIAEGAENRKNSRVYREFEFALPKELTEEQNKGAARDFLKRQADRFKVGVAASFHVKEDPHTGQDLLHCHATFMEREMTEEGLCKTKQRFLDHPEFLNTLRVDWALFANEWLKACGYDVRIDHRSYAEQGIDILPQPKLARGLQTMEQKSEARPQSTIAEIINHPGTVFDPVTQQYAAFNGKGLAQNQASQAVNPPQISERVRLSLTSSSQKPFQISLMPPMNVTHPGSSLAMFLSSQPPLPAFRGLKVSQGLSQGVAPVLILSKAALILPSQAPFGRELKISPQALQSSLTANLPLTFPPLEANSYLTLPTFNQGVASNSQQSQAQEAAGPSALQAPGLRLFRAGMTLKSALVFRPEWKVYQEAVHSSLSPQLPSPFQPGADSERVLTPFTALRGASFQGRIAAQSLKTPLGASQQQQVVHALALDPESCTSSGLNSWQKTAGRPGSSRSSLDLGPRCYDRPVKDGASLSRRLEFDRVRHQNVAKLMANPTKVLDIVTRQQSTFMWGDVEKVLARYVKEEPIYQRLEAQLKRSAELILLREHHHRQEDGTLENVSVYTTRSVLTQELSLMDLAQMMGARQSHGLSEAALEQALQRTRQEMAAKGHDLSPDQLKALRHVTQRDQLSCVIGYAGAGKSTMLKTAKSAWEASGYKVYGLAPTGRAAQNLEEIGLQSQTVHKFLKDYSHGCLSGLP